MRRLAIFTTIGCGLLVIAAATSESDSQTTVQPTGMATSEPATTPLGTGPRLEPFSPYDTGPAEGVWQYDDMSTADKAIVDRAPSEDEARQRVNDVYAGAAGEAFDKAMADLALRRLGLDGIDDVGVVGGVTGDKPGGVFPDTRIAPGSVPGSGGGTGGGGGRGTGGGTGGGGS